MKTSQFYESAFPLEQVLPDLQELEVQEIVKNCDYTIEGNIVTQNTFPDNPELKINQADAVVFYKMGYEAAQERVKEILKPM